MGLTSITNIPRTMRAKGWVDGAQLMDKWFAGPPTAKPAYTTPDLATIKMDGWALKFPRAKTVFDVMVKDKVWSNDKAKPLLATRLRAQGMLGTLTKSFDFSVKSVPDQHALHTNFRTVEFGLLDSLDDMEAALANFSFYAVPLVGDVGPETGRFRVRLSKVGIHIMDSYDFEGDQDLGYWDESTNNVSSSWFGSGDGVKVSNETFRNWRTANSKGGDFLVYSDVKVLTLNPPESFLV